MALEIDVLDVLAAAGLGTKGTDLFAGPVRDQLTSGAAIFALQTGGATPQPDIAGASGRDLRMRRVQVRIRSEKNDFQGGRATADAVFVALHKQAPAAYVGWLCDEAIYIGLDESGRHEFSLNLNATTHDPPATTP